MNYYRAIADLDKDNKLSLTETRIALHFCTCVVNGDDISSAPLQEELIASAQTGSSPPQFMRSTSWKQTVPNKAPRPDKILQPAPNHISQDAQIIPLEQLRKSPEGLDKSKLESYLSEQEFTKVFEVTRVQFYHLPGKFCEMLVGLLMIE